MAVQYTDLKMLHNLKPLILNGSEFTEADKMKTILFRTCKVTKFGHIYASIQLQFIKNKYVVIVTENSDDLFVDFELEIKNTELPDIAIKHFESECIKRFTCDSQFTLEEVKENSGEEISFC